MLHSSEMLSLRLLLPSAANRELFFLPWDLEKSSWVPVFPKRRAKLQGFAPVFRCEYPVQRRIPGLLLNIVSLYD